MKWSVSIFLILFLGPIAGAQGPDTLWTRTYGGPFNDFAHSVDITFEGDYVIVGETYSLESGSYNIYLIKIDPYGDTLWSKTYGGINSEYSYCVIQTSDSGFAITGESRSFGGDSYDVYLLKTDAAGDILWIRTYGGDDYEEGRAICRTSDGGYIITGSTESFGAGGSDVYLIKTNSTGDTTWTRIYGGSGDDWGNSVQQTPDGGFIIAGGTESFGAGLFDVYLIKTDAYGDTLWTKTYGGMDHEIIFCVQPASDYGYILSGWSESFGSGDTDFYIIRTDSAGNIIWSGNYGGPGEEIATSIKQTSDGGYIIAGATNSFGAGNFDVYIIKLLSDQTPVENKESNPKPDDFILYSNYPNPFNASTIISFELASPQNVRLSVYNLLGRNVGILIDDYRETGTHTVTFDASGLSSGVYFYRLDAGDVVETGRMVLLK